MANEKDTKRAQEQAARTAAEPSVPVTPLDEAVVANERAKGVARPAPHMNLTTAASETVAYESAAQAFAEEQDGKSAEDKVSTTPEGSGQGKGDRSDITLTEIGDIQLRDIVREIENLKRQVAAKDEELAKQITVPEPPAVPQVPVGAYVGGMGAIPVSPMDLQEARVRYQAQSEAEARKLRLNEVEGGPKFRVPHVDPVTGELMGYLVMDGRGKVEGAKQSKRGQQSDPSTPPAAE